MIIVYIAIASGLIVVITIFSLAREALRSMREEDFWERDD